METLLLKEETVVYPKGYTATATHVGIKKEKKDLALVVSQVPATAAAVFTTNIVKAAPVQWDMALIEKGVKIKGIVVNSGNANACTGSQGKKDCEAMAKAAGDALGCEKEHVFVSSTGVIGVPMPMDKILTGIKETAKALGDSHDHGVLAAEGIMTTDTFKKHTGLEIQIGGKPVRFGGMSKGSGMIHPNMATMLGFITTDAAISRELLDKALQDCVKDSFNMISVDGDTSTNDTVVVLANGMAENPVIDDDGEAYGHFKAALFEVCKYLAVAVVQDGEGATKLMEVNVSGAKTAGDARKIARSVTSSSLFKAALFGEDANWGRVLCAMGYSGGSFQPEQVTMALRSYEGGGQKKTLALMELGTPVDFDEAEALSVLKEKKIYVDILLKEGDASATAWGCDLSYDYVKINGDYRS